jgi:hypothetical protein
VRRTIIIGLDSAGHNAGRADLDPLCVASSVKIDDELVKNFRSLRCGTLARVAPRDGSGASRGHPAARSPY